MQAPLVLKFLPPRSKISSQKGVFKENVKNLSNVIGSHYFNHLVSVTLPRNQNVSKITTVLEDDGQYYLVQEVDIVELVQKDFIEAFLKRGQLTMISDGTHIDTGNCVAVTPSGHLILSLQRQTYQELGIDGKASSFGTSKIKNRFVIDLDLKTETFTPGKKCYSRVVNRFSALGMKFSFIFTWDPPNDSVCPSSVAAYLESRGYCTSVCNPRFEQRCDSGIRVPVLNPKSECDGSSTAELIEWLGAYSLGVNVNAQEKLDELSTYECPPENYMCDEFVNLQWSGLFSTNKIQKILDEISSWMATHKESHWASIYVQGFADSPVSCGLKENFFFTNGDNNYTIFIDSDNFCVSSLTGSNCWPRKKI